MTKALLNPKPPRTKQIYYSQIGYYAAVYIQISTTNSGITHTYWKKMMAFQVPQHSTFLHWHSKVGMAGATSVLLSRRFISSLKSLSKHIYVMTMTHIHISAMGTFCLASCWWGHLPLHFIVHSMKMRPQCHSLFFYFPEHRYNRRCWKNFSFFTHEMKINRTSRCHYLIN